MHRQYALGVFLIELVDFEKHSEREGSYTSIRENEEEDAQALTGKCARILTIVPAVRILHPMTDVHRRLQLIWNPFLLIAAAFIPLYTFLDWLLVIKAGVVAPREELILYLLPTSFSFIAILVWVRPGLTQLEKMNPRKWLRGFAYFLAVAAIAIPTAIIQIYLEEVTGELTPLQNVDEIAHHPSTRYYAFANYYVDKKEPSVVKDEDIDYNRYVPVNRVERLDLYFVCPVFARPEDTSLFAASGTHVAQKDVCAWVGIAYFKDIPLSPPNSHELDSMWTRFLDESRHDLQATGFGNAQYFERLDNSGKLNQFIHAIRLSKNYAGGSEPIVLREMYDKFENRTGAKPFWALFWFVAGSVGFFAQTSVPKFKNPQEEPPGTEAAKPIE
jgi:hypothetical protein